MKAEGKPIPLGGPRGSSGRAQRFEHQEQRRVFRMPPLSGDALDRVIQGFRQRAVVNVPFDPTPRWPNIRELEDKVRDAEDALERAKAEASQRPLGAHAHHRRGMLRLHF